ncbi:Chromatin-remodeling ATPase INO80 [Labeo rohita]|uniref:Chromatin-remodeling ATPase INO80 n=1 Tax=Labeo rohita TaxID=84645 RepID=A0ABQ8M1Z3_LABRO|nr:Chromatin-remodeling ATPase INO80 [Labeo rohita]
MPPLIPPSSKLSIYPKPSVCPDLSACLDFPLTLPLLPHPLIPASATPPLSPDSPSAHPQPTICAVGSPRVCLFPSRRGRRIPRLRLQPPSPGLHLDPPTQRLRSGSWLPPLHHGPSAHQLHWALLSLRLRLGLHSSSCASSPRTTGSVGLLPPFSSASVLCRSTTDLRISASVALALDSALALRILSVAWTRRLSVSASGSTSTCSAAVGQTPGVISPSSTMAPPSVGSAVDRHHGCGLDLTWLLLHWVPSFSTLAPSFF